MTRLLPVIAVCAGALLLHVWLPAAAQVANPTPTPTAGARPSAQTILARMKAEELAKNTLHLALSVHETVPGKDDLYFTYAIDSSLHPQRIGEVVTVRITPLGAHASRPTSGRVDVYVVGNEAAFRKAGGTWRCGSLGAVLKSFGYPLQAITAHVVSAQLIGTETLDGTHAWHVRAIERVGVFEQSLTAPIDVYVSQADYKLLRFTVNDSLKTAAGPLRIIETGDVSRFGEPVQVTVPNACNTPLEFSIQKVALERPNAKPDWSLKRPSPKRIIAGRAIQIGAYLLYRVVRAQTKVYTHSVVWRDGKRVFVSDDHDTIRLSDQGNQQEFSDTFTPWHTGHFRLTVTAHSGKKWHRKSYWFWVVAAHR